MSTLITVLHVIVCLFLMLTVLLQSGKGGGMGAAFGGGNAATVFGGSGASAFLRRLTAIAGTIFMITSMVLAFLASRNSADALEKYGEEQQKLADEMQQAKDALQSGSGSAAIPGLPGVTPGTTPDPGATLGSGVTVTPAPAAPAAGSAAAPPAPAPPATPPAAPAGSAPVETPLPPPSGDVAPAPTPAPPAPTP